MALPPQRSLVVFLLGLALLFAWAGRGPSWAQEGQNGNRLAREWLERDWLEQDGQTPEGAPGEEPGGQGSTLGDPGNYPALAPAVPAAPDYQGGEPIYLDGVPPYLDGEAGGLESPETPGAPEYQRIEEGPLPPLPPPPSMEDTVQYPTGGTREGVEALMAPPEPAPPLPEPSLPEPPLPEPPPAPSLAETPLPAPPLAESPAQAPEQSPSGRYVPIDPLFEDREFGEAPPPPPEPIYTPLDPGFVDTEFGDLPDLFPNDDLSPPLAGPTPAPPEVAAPGPEPPEVGLPAVAEPATTVPEISAPDHAEPVMAAPESPEPGIEPPTISAPVIASPETASPEAGPVETGQAETGQAESAQPASPSESAPASPSESAPASPSESAPASPSESAPASPSESAPASVSESASTAGGEDITNLDVGGMVEALKAKDWAELHVGDSLYVWLGDELYRRLEDGSLEPTGSVLSPNDTSLDEEGREWLITNDDGSVSISVSLKVWATINFAYNSSDILPESESVLETFSQALKRPALLDKRLLISGHTDSTGTDLFNMGLSRRRAASVAQWLVEKGGLNPDRLILSGYGARMPISDNETDEGRAINRRVEFILLN